MDPSRVILKLSAPTASSQQSGETCNVGISGVVRLDNSLPILRVSLPASSNVHGGSHIVPLSKTTRLPVSSIQHGSSSSQPSEVRISNSQRLILQTSTGGSMVLRTTNFPNSNNSVTIHHSRPSISMLVPNTIQSISSSSSSGLPRRAVPVVSSQGQVVRLTSTITSPRGIINQQQNPRTANVVPMHFPVYRVPNARPKMNSPMGVVMHRQTHQSNAGPPTSLSGQSMNKYDPRTASNKDVIERTIVDAKAMFAYTRKPKPNINSFWGKHVRKSCESKLSAIHDLTKNITSLCNEVAQQMMDSVVNANSAGGMSSNRQPFTNTTPLENYPQLSLQLHHNVELWRNHLRNLISDTRRRTIWYRQHRHLLPMVENATPVGSTPTNQRQKKREKAIILESVDDDETVQMVTQPPTKKTKVLHGNQKETPGRKRKMDLSMDGKVVHKTPKEKKPRMTVQVDDRVPKVSLLRSHVNKLKPGLRTWFSTRRPVRQKGLDRCRLLAKECTKLHREVAKQSQKCADMGVARGRRLGRDIARKHFDALDAFHRSRFGEGSMSSSFILGEDVSVLDTSGHVYHSSGMTQQQEERMAKRRAEKAEAERRKAELELWEAQRQQKKLNFLIKRSELYAHFMAKKLTVPNASTSNTDSGLEETLADCERLLLDPNGDDSLLKPLPPKPGTQGNQTGDQDEEIERMKQATIASALAAARKQQEKTAIFDRNVPALFSTESSEMNAVLDSDSLAQPHLEGGFSERSQPKIFQGSLKPYQLKGMNWLLNLYEQGINGILADEMGLGKTVQTIAMFAALTEPPYNSWGPYLVVAPNSTIHNWVQELQRFVPQLSVTPYWGSPQDRKKLRCRWSTLAQQSLLQGRQQSESQNSDSGTLTGSNAPLHVVVTNYPVVVEDHKMLARIPWQYLVLDEAQAIKSTQSLRWNLLLSFECRNRLLLSGTPIQNTMRELWALLHFIMPSLFDSHEEFNQWFSKDIESQAAQAVSNKGESSGPSDSMTNRKLDANQLRRLHMILKPFMLRRVKADVESELLPKVEIQLMSPLSNRQRRMYDLLRHRIRLTVVDDLCVAASKAAAERQLCNIVMELRKVCNHPDLCHRREPMRFAPRTNILLMDKDRLYTLPQLFVNEDLLHGRSVDKFAISSMLKRHFKLLQPDIVCRHAFNAKSAHFSYLGFIFFAFLFGKRSASQFCYFLSRDSFSLLEWQTVWRRQLEAVWFGNIWNDNVNIQRNHCIGLSASEKGFLGDFLSHILNIWYYNIVQTFPQILAKPLCFQHPPLPRLDSTSATWSFHVPGTCQQPFSASNFCFSSSYVLPDDKHFCVWGTDDYNPSLKDVTFPPLWLEPLDFRSRIADSGKLTALDAILCRLRGENEELQRQQNRDVSDCDPVKYMPNKVLLYSQMTRMLDILEDYMRFRNFQYVRLDGSCRLQDRNEAVHAFQKNPDIFVFLLSTRAGGLGINLTAANIVIFHDSDWNPTVDQQAMDRAHRFGQLRQVTVYRLVCSNSVEQRMLQCASQKSEMQRRVIADADPLLAPNGLNDETVPPVGNAGESNTGMSGRDALNLLLLDDDEMAERLAQRRRLQPTRGRPPKISRVTSVIVKRDSKDECMSEVSTENVSGSISTTAFLPANSSSPMGVAYGGSVIAVESEHDLISRRSWAQHKTRGGGRPRKFQAQCLPGISGLSRLAHAQKSASIVSKPSTIPDVEDSPSEASTVSNSLVDPCRSSKISHSSTSISPIVPRGGRSRGRPRGRGRGRGSPL